MSTEKIGGKIYNEHYDVKRDDGSIIDVVKITDSFYLVDGALCMARPDLNMHSAFDLDFYVRLQNDSWFHYRGAEKGFIISFVWVDSEKKWTVVEPNICHLNDDVRRCAEDAYHEYKKRASV